MDYNITSKTDKEVEVRVTGSAGELQKQAKKAAIELSKNLKINGFRPGKAPYEVVVKEVGEMRILEEAADRLVASYLNEIITKEKLDILSQPQIELEKLAPGNEFIFKAKFLLFPEVTLPDFNKIKIEKREINVEDSEVNKGLEQLQAMRVKEILEMRPAQKGDKVEVDYETQVDDKSIEGGKAEKQGIIIGEGKMIPGFESNLIGLEAGQEKEFELEFPKSYIQELALKRAKFKIKVRGVYKRELPGLDDEFARGLGQKDLDDLKFRIKKNLGREKDNQEKERQELEMIDKVVLAAKFSFIPEELVKETQKRMVKELKINLESQGGKFSDYLKHLKKSEEELGEGFKDEALKRVKTQLIFRKIILDNEISLEDKEVDQQIGNVLDMHASIPKMVEKIKSENYKAYFKEMMLNRKVIQWLRTRII